MNIFPDHDAAKEYVDRQRPDGTNSNGKYWYRQSVSNAFVAGVEWARMQNIAKKAKRDYAVPFGMDEPGKESEDGRPG